MKPPAGAPSGPVNGVPAGAPAGVPGGPPPGPPVIRVFLSHSSADRRKADSLYAAFNQAGIGCFYSPHAIGVGGQYQHEIMRAIDECEVMVVLLSPDAVASKHCLREATLADSKNKILLPFSTGGVKTEKDITAEWSYLLTTIQMSPMTSPEDVVALTQQHLVQRRRPADHAGDAAAASLGGRRELP
ncbi:MAG: toll/interleukin-1 receptor domain-containing protein [Gordonia sp. (in: high G+C Gram-positive bacteria)]|uniref:toll/interleukin-1 receptor domain-containing protein n=1 Tax=Gordonia sp. (in: high G+C Gram-positive bacteria) TaxID=84139 RepID=UPI0039E3CC1E